MDEKAKIVLYKQLMKMELISKMEDKIINWEEFLKLDAKETLKYTLSYRDKALEKYKKIKHHKQNDNEFYLELPDMNLEGQDLSDVYLYMFIAGTTKERNNGKRIFITTDINLKDTNCVINLASIRPIIVSEDGQTVKETVADIKKCDFRGCKVFGKFQNTKARLEYGEENLPQEYIERLSKYKISEDIEVTTDITYIYMIEGKQIKRVNELKKVKQLVDFDLSNMKEDIWKYRKWIKEDCIDISYTGAFIKEYGLESIGKENYYIDIEGRAKEAYKQGNMEYVEEVFDKIDKDTKKNLVTLALRDENVEFAEKHKNELTVLQKKYLEIQDKSIADAKEEEKIKEGLMQKYESGEIQEFEKEINSTSIEIKTDIINILYKKDDLALIQKYLSEIDEKVKDDILLKEYKNGNQEFVYNNFSKIENEDIIKIIINNEWENKNFDFLYANCRYIQDKDIKSEVLKKAFEEEKLEILREHFDELPNELQIEAVIKFKNLGISRERMLELLRK